MATIQCECGRILNGGPCPKCGPRKIDKPRLVKRGIPQTFGGSNGGGARRQSVMNAFGVGSPVKCWRDEF